MHTNRDLRISLAQYNIAWEDKKVNLAYIEECAKFLVGKTDILILPEMCTSGFSMQTDITAETMEGTSITRIRKIACQYQMAICGSIPIIENDKCFNRGFFISPESEYYYDKRHLFRMGEEGKHFSGGNKQVIFNYKGFNICLLVCYDLRFPVWSRNLQNQYDLAIYVANWPTARIKVWETLLKARAIENQTYVCGVNRVGEDNNKLSHSGNSMVINYRGEVLLKAEDNIQSVETLSLSKALLEREREKFPVWMDTDSFNIIVE